MTRTSGRAALISVLALTLFATHVRGEEPKTYRWIGEDGRVYTTTTPPPNGRGVIETKPAAPKQAPAAKPVPPASTMQSLRRLLDQAAEAQAAAEREASGESQPAAAAVPETNPCSRHQYWVDRWRGADRSLQSAQEHLDRLQSDTDRYVHRNDSYYEKQVAAAEDRIANAEEYLSQVETDAHQAGTPHVCLSQ